MYTIGNVMNVRGHAVQCTVFDLEGNHVRTFYFDADTKEIWCHNYYANVEALGHNKTIGHAVPAKTKKEAEAYFKSEEGLDAMVGIIRAMTETLAKVTQMRKAERQKIHEAKQETEPKTTPAMHKHEIFTDSAETYKKLKESTFCTDAACWTLDDGSNYYRITLVAAYGEDWIHTGLDLEHLDYDEVITDVLETK